MELSIVIVNWKVRDRLRTCLRSALREIRPLDGGAEVIVVDNDSRDGSTEMVAREFPSVTMLPNDDNVGFGRANNQALPRCRGGFVLLLNPDAELLPGSLARLLAHARAHPGVAAFGCRLLNADGSLQRWTGGAFPTLWRVARHYLFLDNLFPGSARPLYLSRDVARDLEVDWVSGACLLLRREALGGRIFDPAYFLYGEDMELCHRLRTAGWQVRYTPVVSVLHAQGASMRQQQGEVLLSSLKGLRQFYVATRGPSRVWLLDLITWLGFRMRWAIYGVMHLFVPGRGFAQRAASAAHHSRIAHRLARDAGA